MLFLQFSLLLLVASAFGAGTKIVQGKLEVASEGDAWVLRVGTDAIPVSTESRTRFWKGRAAADAKAFKPGDAIFARIAPDYSPAVLREIADKESWTWLETIRKGVREGTVKAFDGKHLTMSFADGTEMAYRATEKSKLSLAGLPVTLGDLKTGQKLWLKGRTLPTLDVWLVEASDKAIVAPPKKTAGRKTATAKPRRFPASGKLTGEIFLHSQGMGMFDLIVDGVRLHVSYFTVTSFTFGGTKCGANELVPKREATVTYKRDQYGRLSASKVDIR